MKKLPIYVLTAAAAITIAGGAPIKAEASSCGRFGRIQIGGTQVNSGNCFGFQLGGKNNNSNSNSNCQTGITQNIMNQICQQLISNNSNCNQKPWTTLPEIIVTEPSCKDESCETETVPQEETTPQEENTQTPETNPSEETQESVVETSFADQVVALVNVERAKAGLAPLTADVTIAAAADVRARETETYFSHTRPNGTSFSTALQAAGVAYRTCGENIAYGQQTPEAVMNAWMNSSGHRANILKSSYTKIGVGYYENASGVKYWTQLFTN